MDITVVVYNPGFYNYSDEYAASDFQIEDFKYNEVSSLYSILDDISNFLVPYIFHNITPKYDHYSKEEYPNVEGYYRSLYSENYEIHIRGIPHNPLIENLYYVNDLESRIRKYAVEKTTAKFNTERSAAIKKIEETKKKMETDRLDEYFIKEKALYLELKAKYG